ncbi:tRNA (guanosine(37)-N1)-methyltransferase TrmD [Oscillospiraceae bacterium MB08-C2-2]|nr:tRNA (guanosine(37)-N1)-methyltransferase TrmD [Oscillospiraceae bacterium MB08-C2-2]
MRIDIATLFPEMCEAFLSESIIGRARRANLIKIYCHNFRDNTTDRHHRVDDTPYGGGKGMLLLAEPIYRCYRQVADTVSTKPHVIYLSPRGKVLTQEKAGELAKMPHLFLLCGHYEGVDQRVLDEIVDEELSIGDYVLTGGELAAMVLADSVARLCDGVLADESCFTEESHQGGLLEYPHYTKPAVWNGREVPPVLVSGHHANIQRWRREQSLKITRQNRPDMLETAPLTSEDLRYLQKLDTAEESSEE